MLNGNGRVIRSLQVFQRLVDSRVEIRLFDGFEQEIRVLSLVNGRAVLDVAGDIDDLRAAAGREITSYQIDAGRLAVT